MPELPEAETIVRGIRPVVTGRRVRALEIVHADVIRGTPARLRRTVEGRRITVNEALPKTRHGNGDGFQRRSEPRW